MGGVGEGGRVASTESPADRAQFSENGLSFILHLSWFNGFLIWGNLVWGFVLTQTKQDTL